MHKSKLFLIDANSFCYRAFFAIRELSTSTGQPTNAVYGFVTMIKKILQKEQPEYIGICFDVSKDTFRKKQFKEYKAHRVAMPDSLLSQMPIIKEVIAAYNLPVFEAEGYEADDVIATIVKQTADSGIETFIVSSDKDILQLVDERVKVYNPQKDEAKVYDSAEVKNKFNVEPKRMVDLIALMGDKTDNIPGVRGIGEVTATALLEQFGDVDAIYANLDAVKSEKLRATLREEKDMALLSRQLATLHPDVPLQVTFDDLKVRQPDYEKLFTLFKVLEFRSLLKDLPVASEEIPAPQLVEAGSAEALERIVASLTKEDAVFSFVVPVHEEGPYRQTIDEVFFCQKEGEVVRVKDKETLHRIFENTQTRKITYDLKTALIALMRNGFSINGGCFDVMIAAYLLDSSRTNYSLEDAALRYLETSIAESALPQRSADIVFRLQGILEKEMKDKELDNLFYDVEMPLVSVLARMELTGVAIDTQFLKELSRTMEKRMIELIQDIYEAAGAEFNINSPKQLSVVLFEKLKLPIIRRTKTGASTDEEVLTRLSEKHKLPKLILEYRQLMKLKSTYVDALPKLINSETGRLHTSFHQTGTETGRLSSSEPNLQNIPIRTELGRKIRRAIIAGKPGHILLSADYSQIELRVLAHLSKDESLNTAFNNDEDIHRFTASLIYNQPQEEVTGEMRDIAKRINFSIIYGVSAYGLAKDLGIPQDDAQAFIDAYFSRYPKVKDFMQGQIEKARKEGFVTTLLGRRRSIPQIASNNAALRQFAERQAINTPVQGSAADLIKLAMINVQEELEKRKASSRLILQVHDELVFEIPQKELDQIQKVVRDVMENVIKLSVPIGVSVKVGENWLDMKEEV